MRRFEFREASEELRRVDVELESLLRITWEQAEKQHQNQLNFVLAEYPYKHFLLKNGRPLDPHGQPLPADLLVANRVPVGLILNNLLEVVDLVIRSKEVIELPQSLLLRGQLIGLFELIDHQQEVQGRPTTNWTISSGSRSLKFLEFPTQQVQWQRLRSRYKRLITYHKEAVRRLKEIDLIEMIEEVDHKSKIWTTKILYFSAIWFAEIQRQLNDPRRRAAAMELMAYFTRASWKSLARVRYNDDELTDALTEWGGESNAATCKAAYLLLRQSVQVLGQRRPCFSVVNHYTNLGPLDTFKEDILKVAQLNPAILVPMYLEPKQSGFLSLSQLVPSAFDKKPEDSLMKIFEIIWRARNTAIRRGVSVPGLDNLPHLFSKLTFRVKSGKNKRKGLHGSVSTFKISWPEEGRFQRENVPIESFYEPFFANDDLPTPDSRFFRVAMRLDRPPICRIDRSEPAARAESTATVLA